MTSLSDITAVILAGGLGTRLRSVVADRPKVLAEIHGRPFLSHLLDQLAEAGVTHAVLCTGHLGEQVQAAFGDTYGSLQLAYSQEPSPLGTAGAVRLALPLCKSDPVLVMNGDSFCHADLGAFWEWHSARGADGTLLLTEVPDAARYGQIRVDHNGRVLRFDEKGAATGPGWINAGIYLLSQRLIQTIPAREAVSIERQMFPAWLDSDLYGFKSDGRFLDIGTPESYAAAEEFVAP